MNTYRNSHFAIYILLFTFVATLCSCYKHVNCNVIITSGYNDTKVRYYSMYMNGSETVYKNSIVRLDNCVITDDYPLTVEYNFPIYELYGGNPMWSRKIYKVNDCKDGLLQVNLYQH